MVEETGARDKEWSSYMDNETDDALSEMDDLYSPDLGDDWKNWRVDDPELESDETAEERRGTEEEAEELEKGRDGNDMCADPVGGCWVMPKWRPRGWRQG